MAHQIYERPSDYDLEHEDDDEDVAFHVELVRRLAPRRVLELGAGSGRVTLALAREAEQTGHRIVGLDSSEEMLAAARKKLAELPAGARSRVALERGDFRRWRSAEPFDLVIVPCSTMSHVLSLADQLETWRTAFRNLVPGGRLVVDVVMPRLVELHDGAPPSRALVELDSDTSDDRGQRLLRYRTIVYEPHEQLARIRFLYDRFADGRHVDRSLSDFESHQYFPRELELLFVATGFTVESRWGDYRFRPPAATSAQQIVVGRRPARATSRGTAPRPRP